MAKRNRKDKHQKIALNRYSKGGILSTLIAICSLLIIILTIAIAIIQKGNAGIYVGVLGVFALVLSLAGFGIGLKSFNEEMTFLRYTYIGTIANAVIWIAMLGIYLIYV